MSDVFHYSLLLISVVILILSGIGNIFISRHSYKRYKAKKFVSDLLIFVCCMCIVSKIRYGIISSTGNYSLLMLTVLILSRKDKILQISSGRNSLIHKKNVMSIIVTLMLVSLVPQLGTSILHMKDVIKAKQSIGNIIGEAVMLLVATSSIALIVRTISQLKTKVKLIPESNRTLKRSINKLNISFMYVGVFFIFWMPFGIMSAYSHIKKTF